MHHAPPQAGATEVGSLSCTDVGAGKFLGVQRIFARISRGLPEKKK